MIRRSVKPALVLFLVASLGLNVAMLTISGVYAAVSAAVSTVGITTVAAREAGEKLARHNATRKLGRETAEKVTRRMQRGAARSIVSVGGEAIPVVGVAVIAGALVYEVRESCETAADMAGLEAALAVAEGFDLEAAQQAAIEEFDCTAMIRAELPEYDDLPDREAIWAQVKASPQAAWKAASDQYTELQGLEWLSATDSFKDSFADFLGALDPRRQWQDWWTSDTEAQP